jgi:ribosome-associated heat shock protein Hsp15
MPEPDGRLDKWLWCARIVKTRKLAHDLVVLGSLRLNRRKVAKPGHVVRPGDVLTFVWADRLRILKIVAIPPRRAQPAAARLLYEELSEDQGAR